MVFDLIAAFSISITNDFFVFLIYDKLKCLMFPFFKFSKALLYDIQANFTA